MSDGNFDALNCSGPFNLWSGTLKNSQWGVSSYVDLTVPQNGTNWLDNVLTVQNKSVRADGVAGNAAFRFIDSVNNYERGAIGYSRVNTGTAGGYYANTLYCEIGNLIAGDPDDTDFRVIVTHGAGAVNFPNSSLIALEVKASTGDINLNTQGSGKVHVNGGNLLVGQATTSPGADGLLSVTASAQSPITAHAASSLPPIIAYNDQGSGNNNLIHFATDNPYTFRGCINFNRAAGMVAYNTTSDYRAKDVYGPLSGALARVLALKPSVGRMHGAEHDSDFFVAHELQAVVPYAVTGEKDGDELQQVDKSALIPLLVAAIQDLYTELQTLKGQC